MTQFQQSLHCAGFIYFLTPALSRDIPDTNSVQAEQQPEGETKGSACRAERSERSVTLEIGGKRKASGAPFVFRRK